MSFSSEKYAVYAELKFSIGNFGISINLDKAPKYGII